MANEVGVVVDTGVIVSALFFPDSVPSRAFDRAIEGYRLLASPETRQELQEVLMRPRFDRYALPQRRKTLL